MKKLSKFIDFDSKVSIVYDNLYLNDEKIVIKIPLNKKVKKKVKIDVFDLTKYTYLVSYD